MLFKIPLETIGQPDEKRKGYKPKLYKITNIIVIMKRMMKEAGGLSYFDIQQEAGCSRSSAERIIRKIKQELPNALIMRVENHIKYFSLPFSILEMEEENE